MSTHRLASLTGSQDASRGLSSLVTVCDHYFGLARRTGGSHWVYRTPWPGNPRVNIQNDRGAARAYQVRQVLRAIDRLEAGDE